MFVKSSNPDWATDNVTCNCQNAMCPLCDPDFYFELNRDQDLVFIPEIIEPTF